MSDGAREIPSPFVKLDPADDTDLGNGQVFADFSPHIERVGAPEGEAPKAFSAPGSVTSSPVSLLKTNDASGSPVPSGAAKAMKSSGGSQPPAS